MLKSIKKCFSCVSKRLNIVCHVYANPDGSIDEVFEQSRLLGKISGVTAAAAAGGWLGKGLAINMAGGGYAGYATYLRLSMIGRTVMGFMAPRLLIRGATSNASIYAGLEVATVGWVAGAAQTVVNVGTGVWGDFREATDGKPSKCECK